MLLALTPVHARLAAQSSSSQSATLTADEADSASRANAKLLYADVSARDAADSGLARRAELIVLAADSLARTKAERLPNIARLESGRFVRLRPKQDLPDSAVLGYVVIRGRNGRVVAAVEGPVSGSGDQDIETTHYFDSTGTTVAVVRTAVFFNGCTNAKNDSTTGLHETLTSYFGPQRRLLRRTFVRKTFDDRTPLLTDNCNDSYQTVYDIYPSWDSLAAATGLARFLRSAHD